MKRPSGDHATRPLSCQRRSNASLAIVCRPDPSASMTTSSDKFESGCHDQNASCVPSREKAGLVSHGFAGGQRQLLPCRPGAIVTMSPWMLIANSPGRAGPNGGGTRGREPATMSEATAPRAARRPARAGGRPSGAAGAPAASGRARASRAGAASLPWPGDRLDEAGGRHLGRVGGEPGGEEAIDVVVALMPPVLPRAAGRAHRPRGRRASRWSRGAAGTSPCRPARPWHRRSPRS